MCQFLSMNAGQISINCVNVFNVQKGTPELPTLISTLRNSRACFIEVTFHIPWSAVCTGHKIIPGRSCEGLHPLVWLPGHGRGLFKRMLAVSTPQSVQATQSVVCICFWVPSKEKIKIRLQATVLTSLTWCTFSHFRSFLLGKLGQCLTFIILVHIWG